MCYRVGHCCISILCIVVCISITNSQFQDNRGIFWSPKGEKHIAKWCTQNEWPWKADPSALGKPGEMSIRRAGRIESVQCGPCGALSRHRKRWAWKRFSQFHGEGRETSPHRPLGKHACLSQHQTVTWVKLRGCPEGHAYLHTVVFSHQEARATDAPVEFWGCFRMVQPDVTKGRVR